MTKSSDRIALVTGANKGIGYEIAKQLAEANVVVLLGARDLSRGREAAARLASQGIDVSVIRLDICDPESIASAAAGIDAKHGRLDILVNNAGIADYADGAPSVASLDAVRRELETNFIGPLAVTQAMLPLLRKSDAGRIINMTSSLGSLTLNGDPSWPFYDVRLIGYNASKAALNLLTIQLNAELRDTGITAVSACPGLVNTDLSGHRGDRMPSEAAVFPVELALSNVHDGKGAYQGAEGPIPW
ncbi:SDR family oxidoreductase [Rhizobium sp. P38BS-XIX]|uniref:SDR family oxidoreductase n=1 Tax=Rhizobium sp. P38BS-XIX TaxID=2726740 RepID=UPI001456F459|nr:SDR family oxidoreductase [Rhizobium sp. P38BS-XIX]NLS00676.1 SDR family oxidoreductase [Rhizobium sp. P38BS-XIX]